MFLALAMRLLAFPLTPLLLLLGAAPVLGGLPFPLRFSPIAGWSVALVGMGEDPFPVLADGFSFGDLGSDLELAEAELGGEVLSVLGEEPDEPPNILLNSRPP